MAVLTVVLQVFGVEQWLYRESGSINIQEYKVHKYKVHTGELRHGH